MRSAPLRALVRANVRRDLRASLGLSFGVALGVGSLVFFLALGRGLSDAAANAFPISARELEVVVPQGGLFGERPLDDALVAELSRIPGVEAAFPRMALRVPAVTRYQGPFFGKELRIGLEIVGVGAPAALFEGEPGLRRPFADPADPAAPIPVLVNTRLLEVYNKVFAPQRGLPALTPELIVGFRIPLELGRSYVATRTLPTIVETSMVLAGFSDRAPLAGVTFPVETVRRWHKALGVTDDTWSSVLLRARASSDIPLVAAAVQAKGLAIDEGERTRSLQIGAAVRSVTLALTLLSALIVLLAAVNVAQGFSSRVRERRREFGVLRALGATRADVLRLVLAEAFAIGLAGALAGLFAAWSIARLLDAWARAALPDFPFRPERFFAFGPWMFVAGAALAALATLAGALVPARRAAALDPARALTEG